MNKVELQGKIYKVFNGDRVTIITMFIEGESVNFPQIVFDKRNADDLAEFNVGDFVNVVGEVRTRRRKDRPDHTYFEQYISGIKVEKAKSILSEKFGKEIRGYCEYKNEVLIEGTVVFSSPSYGVANILVKPDGQRDNVWLSSYRISPNRVEIDYTKGTKVYALCEIQTVRKETENGVKFFENVIVNEITYDHSPEIDN